MAGDVNLTASNIRKDIDVFGVTGNLIETPADCSANGEQSCVATKSFKAADLTNLAAANIKRGISIAGVTGNLPSTISPLPRYADSGSTTSETGSDETDLTLFASQLTTDGTFEFWDSTGQRYTGSGDSDILAINVREDVAFENLSVAGTMPTAPPATPTGLIANYNNNTNEMSFSWDDMGVSSYLLIVPEGAAVTFTPSDTISYSAGSQGFDTIIYTGASNFYSHTGLSGESIYHYAIYSVNANNYYSAVTTLTKDAIPCTGLAGGTWVEVPGDSEYGTSDFCIMKYEAKYVSGRPESEAADTPWVSASIRPMRRLNAKALAQAMTS